MIRVPTRDLQGGRPGVELRRCSGGFPRQGEDDKVRSDAGVSIVISNVVCVLLQEEEVAGDMRASAGFGLASNS
jgi:hypothetical protein